jgi:hypothetical protein
LAFPKEPQGVELMGDISPARWIEERLWPLKNASGLHEPRVGSLLPEGFAVYARVFHPASLDPGNEPVRWSTVASWTGRTVHPLMQFERIANLPDCDQKPPWGSFPSYGNLPSEECRLLTKVLREFTSTPDYCYFCVWEGYGFLDPDRYRNAPLVRPPIEVTCFFAARWIRLCHLQTQLAGGSLQTSGGPKTEPGASPRR